jgi:bacteriorhodopsin
VDSYDRKLQYGEAVHTYSEEPRYEPPRMHCGCPAHTSDTSGDSLPKNKRWPLWTGFGLLVVPALLFMWKGFEDIRDDGKLNSAFFEHAGTERIVAGFICGIASVAYLTMALGHGYITRCCDGRSFYYARYVDWALTTPLQLWELGTFSEASPLDRLFVTVIDGLMIVGGLIGALICESEKWAFWGFGMLCFVPILWFLCAWDKRTDAKGNAFTGAKKAKMESYRTIMNITVVTWIVYPIIWIVSEGTGKISVYGEAIAYTILDIIAKSVFGWIIVRAVVPPTAPAKPGPKL